MQHIGTSILHMCLQFVCFTLLRHAVTLGIMVCRPSLLQNTYTNKDDDEDEDAPALVEGLEEDVSELQHDSLRAAFPIAFGELPMHQPLQQHFMTLSEHSRMHFSERPRLCSGQLQLACAPKTCQRLGYRSLSGCC